MGEIHCPHCGEDYYVQMLYETLLVATPELDYFAVYQCNICDQTFSVQVEASNG